jgi:hypothetical protein
MEKIETIYRTPDGAEHPTEAVAQVHAEALETVEKSIETFAAEIKIFLGRKSKNPATVADFLHRWEKHKLWPKAHDLEGVAYQITK